MTILREDHSDFVSLGSCLFGGVVSLQADHRSDCETYSKGRKHLYKEIRKHGEHSRRAENRRRSEQARYGCREVAHHRYYDRSRYGSL